MVMIYGERSTWNQDVCHQYDYQAIRLSLHLMNKKYGTKMEEGSCQGPVTPCDHAVGWSDVFSWSPPR